MVLKQEKTRNYGSYWNYVYGLVFLHLKKDSRMGKKVCETKFKGRFTQNVFLHLKLKVSKPLSFFSF